MDDGWAEQVSSRGEGAGKEHSEQVASSSHCVSWSVSKPECLGLRFECGLSSDNRFTEMLEKGQLNEGLDVVPLVECLPSMHTNNPGFNPKHHIHRVWSCTTAIPACESQLQVGGALGIRG